MSEQLTKSRPLPEHEHCLQTMKLDSLVMTVPVAEQCRR